jgi:hypothetical protein
MDQEEVQFLDGFRISRLMGGKPEKVLTTRTLSGSFCLCIKDGYLGIGAAKNHFGFGSGFRISLDKLKQWMEDK